MAKKTYQRCVNKPNFISQKIFDKNFVAIHCVKTVLTLNKPIYVRFSILELIKCTNFIMIIFKKNLMQSYYLQTQTV